MVGGRYLGPDPESGPDGRPQRSGAAASGTACAAPPQRSPRPRPAAARRRGRRWSGPATGPTPPPHPRATAQAAHTLKEQISTRVKVRPELKKAFAPAHQFKEAAPETPVIFTVHELKRLARNAAESMTLSAELQADGIQLELLTGPLTGIYDPNGMGAMFFAVLAVAGQIERNYIREKTLEGQVIAASKGNHGGRPKVIDDDMLTFAVALKDKGVPVPDIAKKLTIKVGKNAGKHPSVASLYRALAEAEAAAADDDLPLRPKPVRIRRPEGPLTPEEIDLRDRLQAQPHPNAGGTSRG
ncbi:recombinase family protein [Streptomyces shenzhenensis]|uniref:recombinase family protein n=1 Tax=Streptomyces shenzhenensis TaxID=943815 RepID=UPI0038138423